MECKIKELLAEASPGPWATSFGYEQSDRGNYIYSVANGLIVCAEQDDTDCELRDADAHLIVALRNNIEDLLEDIDTLRFIRNYIGPYDSPDAKVWKNLKEILERD